jgi:hypothetical protein
MDMQKSNFTAEGEELAQVVMADYEALPRGC